LVALIFVYIIVLRVIRPFMHWYAAKQLGISQYSDTDASLEEAIERLAKNLAKLNAILINSTAIIEEFRKKITIEKFEKFEKFFKACSKALPIIEKSCSQQPAKLEEIINSINTEINESRKHSGYLETQTNSQTAMNQNLELIKYLLSQKDMRDKRNRKLFGKILNVFKGYGEE